MSIKQKMTLRLSALAGVCALALAVGGIGFATSVEASPAVKTPPPPTKTMEKKSLSDVKEQAKEHAKEKMKEDAKEKVAEKLGIEQKQPMKPGMPKK